MFRHPSARVLLTGLALASAVLLGACSSEPSNITAYHNAPTPGVDTQPVKWTAVRPGCQGDSCPRITVDSLTFPSLPRLSELVDSALAAMTGIDQSQIQDYDTLKGYEAYFWKTAQPNQQTQFHASVRGQVGSIVSVELHTDQYLGGAHGIPATEFVNWSVPDGKVLTLDGAILAGRKPLYVQALKDAYQQWLQTNDQARENPVRYQQLWPFKENDNFALTPAGLVVKYQAYDIAPYSMGQPELTIPYAKLGGILAPRYMPSKS